MDDSSPMNNNIILSSESISSENKCIDNMSCVTTMKQEKKLSVLSSPLSPTITAASTEDSSFMTEDEEVNDKAIESDDPATTSADSSPEIAKTPTNSSSEEVLVDDWNLVVAPDSEGEASVVPLNEVYTAATAVEECSSNQGEGILNTSEEGSQAAQLVEEGVQVSMSDLQELRRLEQDQEIKDSAEEIVEPMKMLRKGVVAAGGGFLVGLGLIMIPLPIPLGAVVASSGMAVLGTEFDGAREMNEKIIDTAKTHWAGARDKIIQGIEDMESQRPTTIHSQGIPVAGGTDSEKDQWESSTEEKLPPIMNPAEMRRQEELAKKRTKAMEQAKFFANIKRSTGTYLSRHLIPILRRGESEVGSVPDADITVQSETETLSEIDQTEDLKEALESYLAGEEPKSGEEVAAPVESISTEQPVASSTDEPINATETLAPLVSL